MKLFNCICITLFSIYSFTEAGVNYKKEVFNGVQFYFRLPNNPTEIKGVVIEGIWSFDKTEVDRTFTSNFVQHAHNHGYAVISWLTPVEAKKLKSYGYNSNDLSKSDMNLRKKNWGKWMSKVSDGLNKLKKQYGIPTNGYIAHGHCLGCNRLSRFIENYPEKFSFFIASKPLGMFLLDEDSKHIYTHLISDANPQSGTESSFKRFIAASHDAKSLCSATYLKNRAYLDRSKLEILKYSIKVRDANNVHGVLSKNQIRKCAEMIEDDFKFSKYAYDITYRKWSDKGKDRLLGYKKYIVTIPSKEIYESCLIAH